MSFQRPGVLAPAAGNNTGSKGLDPLKSNLMDPVRRVPNCGAIVKDRQDKGLVELSQAGGSGHTEGTV